MRARGKIQNVVSTQYAFSAKGIINPEYTLLLENPRWRMFYVHFVSSCFDDLLQTFVIHTDSSTFKLYFIAQDIKVGCAGPEEFWSPTWRLHVTFESWSPAQ